MNDKRWQNARLQGRRTGAHTRNGDNIVLITDDTLTLAILSEDKKDTVETTPDWLGDTIDPHDLVKIAEKSPDQNERGKAAEALAVYYGST